MNGTLSTSMQALRLLFMMTSWLDEKQKGDTASKGAHFTLPYQVKQPWY